MKKASPIVTCAEFADHLQARAQVVVAPPNAVANAAAKAEATANVPANKSFTLKAAASRSGFFAIDVNDA